MACDSLWGEIKHPKHARNTRFWKKWQRDGKKSQCRFKTFQASTEIGALIATKIME
jgi:hypothetical protein